MSSNASIPDKDSDDSDTTEVFLNQFSDNDEDDESIHDHDIFTVRNTNALATDLRLKQSPIANSPYGISLKSIPDQGADKNVRSGTYPDNYSDTSSDGSEYSYTDTEDLLTDSDDDLLEGWEHCSKPQRSQRNKNVIPMGGVRGIVKTHKHVQSPTQIKEFPTNTKGFSKVDVNDDNKGRMSLDVQSHQNLSQGRAGNDETDQTRQKETRPKQFKTPYKQPVTSLPSDENVGRNQFSAANSNVTSHCGVESTSSNENSKRPMKGIDDIGKSQPNSEAALNSSAQLLLPEHSEDFSVTSNAFAENWETGSYYGTNTSETHQLEYQSRSHCHSVFRAWNKNWTTDDYLICPNFLSGVHIEEDIGNKQRVGHRRGRGDTSAKFGSHLPRMPRMFHRRRTKLNEDDKRATSREDRFSEVASMMKTPLTELFKVIKETGLDVTKVLGQADKLGLPMQFPCMQCHESSMMSEVARDFITGSGYSSDGRCKRCGGQLQTLDSLGKMIAKIRDTVAKNNFEIRDVYPDGNCMFGTVIDQLRVRGDFRYTVRTLRKAVVDYLKENPNAEDGTPLEMFLSNETWEEYLTRMSEDGQWGDHMVLNAITNVLQMRIVIFGGRNGETETVLVPKVPDGEKSEATNNEVTGKEFATIFMGHLGETHYVSFRPENWWQTIQEKNFQASLAWDLQKFDPLQSLYVPVAHLDFILKHTINLEHISYSLPELANIPTDDVESEFTVTLVGPIMCKMVPDYTSQVESIAPDISVFFPDTFYKVPSKTCILSVFQIPRDTCIQDAMSEHKRLNLLTEKSSTDLSHVRLSPVLASLWEGQTIASETGTVYLKAIDLESIPFETFLSTLASEKFTIHRTLAFKSEWPEVADEWISRERKSGKPEELVIQSVASIGCHVVPITSNENLSNVIDSFITDTLKKDQCLWSYSFAVAEMRLSHYLSHSQRCCFLFLKSMLDSTCNNPMLPDALLKSVFFYACENIEESTWSRMPGRCLIIMIEKLAIGLRMNFIPHYFISAQNLLQNIPQEHIEVWSKYIEGILTQPIISLHYVLDMLDITSSEIGTVFDDVIEDLPKFNSHQSIERSFNETIVHASGTLIENLIYQREYHFAMITFDDIHEQVCRFTKQPIEVVRVMQMVLSMPLGYCWCFGLYIDLVRGTTVTRDIGKASDPVHITEIFGPDIDDEVISNTVVPSVYSIPSGDLKFPSVCADVMIKAGKRKLLAKCLRYYIDTYSEIAGDNIVIQNQTYQPHQLKLLQGLYMTLLETYDELGCPGKFRELMDKLTTIVQLRQVHSGFHDLAFAWETLGEPELAIECCPCYNNHKSGSMKNLLQRMFGGMGDYQYDYY